MAEKVEKEKQDWQTALEGLEKRLLEVVEESNQKMTKDLKDELKGLVQAEVADLKKEVGEIKQELQASIKQMQEIERKSQLMEINLKETKEDSQKFQEHMILMQCKVTEKYLRLRGVPESAAEHLHERIVAAIAEFLKEQPDEIDYHFDIIYRVNSAYAEKKNLPRDVIVQLLTKNLKEQILRKHYKEPLEIDGSKIKVMKELPRSILEERKKYKKLTES